MDVRHFAITTITILLFALPLTSCRKANTHFVTDVDDINLQVEIKRFDKDILTFSLDSLYDKYDEFVNVYTFGVLNLNKPEDIVLFTSDSDVQVLYAETEQHYENVRDIERELTTAFRYFSYYFPTMNVPEFLFHISGFNQNIVVTDDVVSASIDLYLGSDCEFYQGMVYDYELPQMTRDRLPVDMAYAWISTEFSQEGEDRLLDNMLYRGKLLYMLMVMFPNRSEHNLLGYSEAEYAWAKRFEENIWASMLEKKQLYSSDWLMITQMLNPAPFTQGFSQDSPGRLGEFIGLQIVKSYMKSNRDKTLLDMFALSDAEKMLRDSHYKP